MISYRQYTTESCRHNQTFDLQPKTYCFGIDIRLLFLVSIARPTNRYEHERRQTRNRKLVPDHNTIFFPKILSNHNVTRDNYNSSIQNNFVLFSRYFFRDIRIEKTFVAERQSESL